MRRSLYYFVTSSLMLYLISCTSSDRSNAPLYNPPGKAVKTSMGEIESQDQILAFSEFLQKISKEEIIAAADEDLHQLVAKYFPDTTIAKGFDLHAQDIGSVDNFRLVFYEYFDLYENWSNTYLGVYSPSGEVLDIKRLWEVSFEGNIGINLVDDQTLEIAYYDFFTEASLKNRPLISDDHFYLQPFAGKKKTLEGYVHEYYQIQADGQLTSVSQNNKISIDRRFPQASALLLAEEELSNLPMETLQLMQQEILAGHGMIFEDQTIQNYFDHQSWYEPIHQSVDTLLSAVEKLNMRQLQQLQVKQY